MKRITRLLAFGLCLSGSAWAQPAGYSICYAAHVQDIGWQDFVCDDAMAGTTGRSRRLEALNIYFSAPDFFSLTVRAHVHEIGWQDPVTVTNDIYAFVGTVGQSRAIEAIQISLDGAPLGVGVCYDVHVQGLGWLGYKCDGDVNGTTGQDRRMEAIKITFRGP